MHTFRSGREGRGPPKWGVCPSRCCALPVAALPGASSREGREDLEVCRHKKRPDPVQARASPRPTTLHAMSSLQTVSGSFDGPTGLLFIFRSRYLSAIGLSSIFSFRWNAYHPLCAAIPNNATRDGQLVRLAGPGHGAVTLCGALFQETCRAPTTGLMWRLRLQFASPFVRAGRFGLELFPLHSQLLGESWLVSFPPLSKML